MPEMTKTNSMISKPRVRHFICGSLSGAGSTFLLYPLDLIRTRMQVSKNVSNSWIRPFISSIQNIYKEGGLKTFYQGITPGLIGSVVSWGCYFLLFENAKTRYRRISNKSQLTIGYNLLSSIESGVITTCITAPIWVIKTRMQLQQKCYTPKEMQYKSFLNCITNIIKNEGIKALYSGLIPSLFLVSHGIIQFTSYEELKHLERSYGINDVNNGTFGFINGALSKSIAVLMTYPLQVSRSRLQQCNAKSMYTGLIDCLRICYKNEGIIGLYSGFVPNILRTVPNSSILFMTYEVLNKLYSTLL